MSRYYHGVLVLHYYSQPLVSVGDSSQDSHEYLNLRMLKSLIPNGVVQPMHILPYALSLDYL